MSLDELKQEFERNVVYLGQLEYNIIKTEYTLKSMISEKEDIIKNLTELERLISTLESSETIKESE